MSAAPLEIERSYLLTRVPELPTDERNRGTLRIEQGYLPESTAGDPSPGLTSESATIEGRIRRTVHPDGRVSCVHTIKRGVGLVRTEQERTMEPDEFDRLWPHTVGRRLSKDRHRIHDAGFLWEIDRFHDLDLVLAEVELPTPEAVAPLPEWLQPQVVREVTDEPEYRNYEIARRARTS